MAHVMKHTKASCGHMFAHFDRRAEHISNENLDRTRTHLNYNLAIHQQMDQGEFVRKRCSEVRMQNRKDVNIMASWVVTVPKDLPLEEHKQFFQGCYDFLENRYGKENVVSSYVHMDEITPHMHFAFVPVVPDKKRDGFKVSAKECITRTDLQSFHQQLETHLENVLGHEVGILNEATREGNKSIAELKRSGATERLKSVEKEIEAKKDSLIPLQAEYEAKKAFVKQIGKLSRDTSLYPEGVKVSKKIFGEEEIVTVP
ncbi:MAG: plasmid recombination protein, partial [Paludibacteraceae bacterium]|nr:plasmid recombination protein [Paludibacteraceae bacterium]